MKNSEADPASFYPSPRQDSEQLSNIDSLEAQTNTSQTLTDAAALDIEPEVVKPEAKLLMPRQMVNSEVINAVGEEEERPRALPLPLEHIYVHDSERALLLSDFQVTATLGSSI